MDKTSLIDAELLLKMVNASSDGIVVAEQEGDNTILIYVNDAFEKLTGYKDEEILYKDCRFLQGNEPNTEARQVIRESIASGEPCRVTMKNFRKDGSMFWNELSITPVYNELDQLTYFIGIQKDVTETKQLEAALKEAENAISIDNL